MAPRYRGLDVVKLNASPVTVPFFFDTTADQRVHQHYYYTVVELFSNGTETPLSDPVTLYARMGSQRHTKNISLPRIFVEWKRRKNIILGNTAESTQILVRKRAGTRCSCFSGEYEAPKDSTCLDCFGTGWDKGYVLIPDVLVRFLSIAEVLELQPAGLHFKSGPRAWLVDFPVLRNGDIFIRRNGERYEVNNLDLTVHQGFLTEQGMDVVALEVNHPAYRFNIVASETQHV